MKKQEKRLMSIGHFQFENLVRSRVPFHLIAIKLDPTNLITNPKMVLEKTHLQKCVISSKVESRFFDFSGKAYQVEVQRLMSERSMEKDAAILILSEKEKKSVALAEAFVKQGFLNVFYVEGGISTLQF